MAGNPDLIGVDDFGIYNVAGSVVALFGFFTGALDNSSSRFITVEIGKVKDGNISIFTITQIPFTALFIA